MNISIEVILQFTVILLSLIGTYYVHILSLFFRLYTVQLVLTCLTLLSLCKSTYEAGWSFAHVLDSSILFIFFFYYFIFIRFAGFFAAIKVNMPCCAQVPPKHENPVALNRYRSG